MCGYRKLKKNADVKISAFITLQEKLYKLVHGGYSFLKSHARIVCPYLENAALCHTGEPPVFLPEEFVLV